MAGDRGIPRIVGAREEKTEYLCTKVWQLIQNNNKKTINLDGDVTEILEKIFLFGWSESKKRILGKRTRVPGAGCDFVFFHPSYVGWTRGLFRRFGIRVFVFGMESVVALVVEWISLGGIHRCLCHREGLPADPESGGDQRWTLLTKAWDELVFGEEMDWKMKGEKEGREEICVPRNPVSPKKRSTKEDRPSGHVLRLVTGRIIAAATLLATIAAQLARDEKSRAQQIRHRVCSAHETRAHECPRTDG